MNSSGVSRLSALIYLFITFFLSPQILRAAPGDLDPLDVPLGGNSPLTSVVQPDGKILIGGDFTSVLGVPRNRIARLNADGTLDAGFDPNANNTVESIVVQADGKILIGGYFTTLQPDAAGPVITRRRIARLHADGALDATFDPNTDREVLSMTVQADGKIVIVGRFSTFQPNGAATTTARSRVARLLPDGTLDTGFSVGSVSFDVYTLAMQGDGKILVAGDFISIGNSNRVGSARLNANGTVDTSFTSAVASTVNSIAVQPDGKILIGGDGFGMARLNANGTRDTAFNPNANNRVYSMAVQADGKILIAGYFTSVRSAPRNYIARLHPDGTLDTGFDPNASNSTGCVTLQADGRILLGGSFSTLQPNGAATATPRGKFARLLNDPATEVLAVPTTNQVGWSRGGSAPELSRVTFELSTDSGATWNPLGPGARVGGTSSWQVTGLSLPPSGQIRAQGVTSDGNGSTGGLVESVTSFSGLAPLPEIAVFAGASTAAADERVDNFGTHLLGSAAQTFTIKNTGLADLTGLAISLSGDAPGDYVLGTLGATTLPPGGTTTFTVTFAPTTPGVRNAVVNVSSNDADEGTFRVKIANLTPEIAVRGNSYNIDNGDATPSVPVGTDFGDVALSGEGSTITRTFTIANTGGGSLTFGAVSISGEHAADFSVVTQPVSPVAANGSRSFKVTFDPSGLGLRKAVVSFDTNDADENPFSFSIQGTGFLSSNANLSDLRLSAGTLSPSFSPATTSYTASVPYGDESVRITATKAEANASMTLRVNGGSDTAFNFGSEDIPLNVGVNVIEVKVTAQDGTVRTYTLSLTRTVPAAGDPDFLEAFGSGYSGVYAVATQPDGKVIIGGYFYSVLGVQRGNIARFHVDGTLDTSFDPYANNTVESIAVQADGKILVGGSFSALQPNGAASPIARNRIARLNADGTVDASFDPNADATVYSMALQADGKVLVGGDFSTLQPNGAGVATARNRIARLNADGSLDSGFDPRANNQVASVVVQEDGKILLGGAFTSLQPNGMGATRYYIARLNADGTVDSGFNPWASNFVSGIALQADGKVLLGGDFAGFRPNGAASITTRNRIARLNADGTVDANFNVDANGRVSSVAVQADGKILLGGSFYTVRGHGALSATERNRIARVNANGTLDASFNPNANGSVHEIAVQADGKILLGGDFTSFLANGASMSIGRNRFARLFNDPAVQSLGAADATRVSWVRGGATPEVSQVTFELSTDGGTSFAALGNASRVGNTADWQLSGLNLPAGGMLRARGRIMGGGSSGMVEAMAVFGNFASPLTSWRQAYFGSPGNSGFGADAFDFDKDGLVNLIEYAFGLNPTVPDGGQLPQAQRAGGNLMVSFTQPAGVSGVTYGADWSDDLETWVPLTDTGAAPQHVFSVPTAGKETLFMRLRVSAP